MNAESLERGHAIIAGAKELCGPQWLDAPTEEGYWWRAGENLELVKVRRRSDGALIGALFQHQYPIYTDCSGHKWLKANITPPEHPKS